MLSAIAGGVAQHAVPVAGIGGIVGGIVLKTLYDKIAEFCSGPPAGKLAENQLKILQNIQAKLPPYGEDGKQPAPFFPIIDEFGNPRVHWTKGEPDDLYCRDKLTLDSESKKTALAIITRLRNYFEANENDGVNARSVFAGGLKLWMSCVLVEHGDRVDLLMLDWIVQFLINIERLISQR
jgi:hypothetical protein